MSPPRSRDLDPKLATVIVAGSATEEGVLGYDDLLDEVGEPAPPVDIPNDSPALIMYTSGTTGRPKGAVLTHANLAGQAMTNLFTTGADINNDVGFIGVPLFHIAGIGNMITGLLLGLPTVVYPLGAFDPGALLDVLEAEKVTGHLPRARAVAGGLRRTTRQSARAPAARPVVGRRTGVGLPAARHVRDISRQPDPGRVRADRDVTGYVHVVGERTQFASSARSERSFRRSPRGSSTTT